MRSSPPPRLFDRDVRRIHCVGVGGMGVAPLAVYLAQAGFTVSGEDDALTDAVRALLERERVAIGPIPADCDLIACSSAIAKTHAAYAAAAARGLPLVRRGDLLAEVARDKRLVAVCGSHGKTTTTAMLITALRGANFPAGYVLGGLFADDLPPARAGSNDWLVAEIDESDGTIDRFAPEITVTVNLDWDHPDYYRQLADLEATFAALFARTRGTVLVNDACPLSQRIAGRDPRPERSYRSFGRSGDFSGEIREERAEGMTLKLGGCFGTSEAAVRARGEFNAANATAALAAAQLMGVVLTPRLLADFHGVRRRQDVLYAANGLTVLEDYAHHPSEIRALLASLRPRVADAGRLVVVFQPHRFSRTAQFKAEFAAALALGDRVHLLDVYPAGEAPIAGGTTADIYAELKRGAPALPVSYLPGDDPEFFRALTRDARAGDLVAMVGAGDIDQKARAWLVLLEWEAMKEKRWDELAAAVRPRLSSAARLRREEPLAPKTTMRVGGAARLYAEPASAADLRVLWTEAQARGVELFWLGRGSNL
ncbi:MAG TPA: cyanophycin synthetase, partial [Opitutaceae bacterium]|nr:cyanophycin synthetase [Opitutaceae bacterium]